MTSINEKIGQEKMKPASTEKFPKAKTAEIEI